ncbi:MAG: hypothetical protein KF795_08995 [Labilithrix sp.]|nr:hypothetical protein [Labilithrix sp.]
MAKTPVFRRGGEPRLVLELEDGSDLSVDIASRQPRLTGFEKRARGAWSTILEVPAAAAYERDIVPPFTEVELVWIEVAAGDDVVVGGSVSEEAFAADGGPRAAPTTRPSAMIARVIAVGEDANARAVAELERERAAVKREAPARDKAPTDAGDPRTRPLLAAYAPAALVLAVAVAFGIARSFGWQRDQQAWTLLVLLVAMAFALRPARFMPDFHARTRSIETVGYGTMMVTRMVLGVIPVALVLQSVGTDLSLSDRAATFLAAFFLLAWAVTVVLVDLHPHRTLAGLLNAPRWTSGSGTAGWAGIEGVVRDPTPIEIAGTRAAIGLVIRMSKGLGSNPDEEEGRTLLRAGTYVIDVGSTPIVVDPEETIWASTARRHPEDSTSRYDIEEWIPVGGRVLACGRIEEKNGELHLHAQGTRPAAVFATGAAGDPAAFARAVRRHRLTTIAVLVGAAAAALLLLDPRGWS